MQKQKANYYVQKGCSFQMRHRLMAYIDRLIEKNERIYEFRAEGRLNKVAIEKAVLITLYRNYMSREEVVLE
mgnify:FL=1